MKWNGMLHTIAFSRWLGIVAIGVSLLTPHLARTQSVPAAPAMNERADYVFADSTQPNSEPDPGLWTKSGTRDPQAIAGAGLAITDSGNGEARLYYRLSPLLARGGAAASVTAIVRTPPVSDTSPAWNNGTLGFRLILDDGARRLEVALARNQNGEREILIASATRAARHSFPWDNNFHNFFQIRRQPDGVFTLEAKNTDPAGQVKAVNETYAPSDLPKSDGRALAAWGSADAGGGVSIWQEVRMSVAPAAPSLVVDTSQLEVDLGNAQSPNRLDWRGQLSLPAGTRLDPAASPFVVKVSTGASPSLEATIPASSFVLHPDGSYRYTSAEGSVPRLRIRLVPKNATAWEFRVGAEALFFAGTELNDLTGTLAVNELTGSQTVPLRRDGSFAEFTK